MILFEWDEGNKEEREPHAGGSAHDGRCVIWSSEPSKRGKRDTLPL